MAQKIEKIFTQVVFTTIALGYIGVCVTLVKMTGV